MTAINDQVSSVWNFFKSLAKYCLVEERYIFVEPDEKIVFVVDERNGRMKICFKNKV